MRTTGTLGTHARYFRDARLRVNMRSLTYRNEKPTTQNDRSIDQPPVNLRTTGTLGTHA